MNKRAALILVSVATLIVAALVWRGAGGSDPLVVEASDDGKRVTAGGESPWYITL